MQERWSTVDGMPRHRWFGEAGWVQDLSDLYGVFRAIECRKRADMKTDVLLMSRHSDHATMESAKCRIENHHLTEIKLAGIIWA